MLPITYLTGDLYLEYIYKELLKLNNEEKIAKWENGHRFLAFWLRSSEKMGKEYR